VILKEIQRQNVHWHCINTVLKILMHASMRLKN